ncbi:uncharacterized protein A1O9_12222 [Exophiala aquamarina CBS 119918]|uniref:Fumarylacetoacetase-like C-terminal domain-containing protein n=1 Tax=Exophiala aquamarina CBS 119918 TaxID=1182545 RepID=A0A072NW01_9EURO|nr:uncharacterized protein A1O9_12222 [Exophiala aquamarina CBS 119918]KEF51587.1 hypothetical protein A1O9_12222 [Exophiala aquamarina CBS 119918]
MKPSTAVAAFDADIRVLPLPKGNPDYEGELLQGRHHRQNGQNISKQDAISYVVGYAASNDVSARMWPNECAYGVGATFAKSFHSFNPLGPVLVAPSIVGSTDNLKLRTTVNGGLRQDSSTSDMLFNVAAIISFLS